jgi:hypothetical protein
MRGVLVSARLPVRRASATVPALAAAAPLALLVAHLLPASGPGLAIRLAAAAACVLLVPGALLLGAVGRPPEVGAALAAAVCWSLAAVFGALLLTFAFSSSLELTAILLGLVALAALVPAALTYTAERDRAELVALAAVGTLGIAFAAVVWAAAGPVAGDGLFHLGRERKLAELDELASLQMLNEFRDGGLHPGYAFPLWHAAVALVATLAGVDVADAARYLPAVLTPLSLLLVFAAGRALFDSVWTGAAAVLAQLALTGLGPGHAGGYTSLAQPGPASRHLVVPALLALTLTYVRGRQATLLLAITGGGLALALMHPTYALFLCVVVAGFLLARALLAGKDMATIAAALAAMVVPAGAVAFWILPVVRDTIAHEPSGVELQRSFAKYPGQLEIFSQESFRLAPEVLGRSGAAAVAALVLLPLAALAPRRRWAAFVLGGGVTVMALLLVPELFTRLTDVVSLSQARRLGAFLPFAFAFAGGVAALAGIVGVAVAPLALAAGFVLQEAYPGDFGYRVEEGGPALAGWIAAFGGAAGLAVGMAFSRRLRTERHGPVVLAAVALFALPVAAHGLGEWGPRRVVGTGVTPGLIEAVRTEVPEGAVVFSDIRTSYTLAAYAPVYIAAAPPSHVANTTENRPYDRRRATNRFLATGDLAIPRRYGAGWIVIDKRRFDLRLPSRPAYEDARYVLHRM